jgi:hypothetical protein
LYKYLTLLIDELDHGAPSPDHAAED